jgi:hypothetical protein
VGVVVDRQPERPTDHADELGRPVRERVGELAALAAVDHQQVTGQADQRDVLAVLADRHVEHRVAALPTEVAEAQVAQLLVVEPLPRVGADDEEVAGRGAWGPGRLLPVDVPRRACGWSSPATGTRVRCASPCWSSRAPVVVTAATATIEPISSVASR